ncbi:hypothetical protein BN2497_9605 [Janthinobacterium sp. CG23_2]|nr:hypothetical protein BN2497_9605 [Janthinobacterium sp. CG23_2]CUU31200.1 hypothetical protein BN3177_9605 [Janthinobacterium sp. CG23_2]
MKYLDSYGDTETISEAVFEGIPTMAMTETRADGTLFGIVYQHVIGTTLYSPGIFDYTANNIPSGKYVNSADAKMSLDLAPGQSTVTHYTVTQTRYPENTTSIVQESAEFTFAGFETVTVANRTFANACKITFPTDANGNTYTAWFAKGFGKVRTTNKDAKGVIVPGGLYEIVKILAAP